MEAVTALVERLSECAAKLQRQSEPIVVKTHDDSVTLSPSQLSEATQAVADELVALQAIYGEHNVALLAVQKMHSGSLKTIIIDEQASDVLSRQTVERWNVHEPIRLALSIPLEFLKESTSAVMECDEEDRDAHSIKLSAVLPPGYPMISSPPQLQLLSRYVGPHGVDHTLFGTLLRVFMQSTASTSKDHIVFQPGQVVLFDGIEKARELVERWFDEREADRIQREEESSQVRLKQTRTSRTNDKGDSVGSSEHAEDHQTDKTKARDGANKSSVRLFTAPAITERKSTFLAHAAPLGDPSEVPAILASILQDRRVARATHPAIYAWVCKTNDGVVHRDCDDDGETAAGGRLAHLLDLLHIDRAIVVVTRWYGGVQLGPDRFKLINRAARDALEVAGLIQ